MECYEATQFWPVTLFVIGFAMTAFLVQRKNKLALKNLWRVMIGLESFTRTTSINLMQAATLIVPMGLWVWLAQSC